MGIQGSGRFIMHADSALETNHLRGEAAVCEVAGTSRSIGSLAAIGIKHSQDEIRGSQPTQRLMGFPQLRIACSVSVCRTPAEDGFGEKQPLFP